GSGYCSESPASARHRAVRRSRWPGAANLRLRPAPPGLVELAQVVVASRQVRLVTEPFVDLDGPAQPPFGFGQLAPGLVELAQVAVVDRQVRLVAEPFVDLDGPAQPPFGFGQLAPGLQVRLVAEPFVDLDGPAQPPFRLGQLAPGLVELAQGVVVG